MYLDLGIFIWGARDNGDIKKVYNNNVILAFENSSKKEVILTGCGIGFGKKPNDTIDDSKIEKKFVIQDNNFESKVNKLASEIPEGVCCK